jgi:hypothetical protein
MTVCPFCQTSGTELPRADPNFLLGEGPDDEQDGEVPPAPRLAVICPTCDEPWTPDFLRVCEWCSHDFGAGIASRRQPTREPQEISANPRITAVAAMLAAVVLGMFVYFLVIAGG